MGSQPGTQQRPKAFQRIDMDFMKTISIFNPSVLASQVIDFLVMVTPFGQAIINVIFISIYPERIDDRWWRKEGHWLQLADLRGVRETHPSVLVVGTGYFERMHVDPSVSDWLQQQGITLIACDTTRACAEFN